ncbi:membrane protein [Legionella lansingensis]|uniref:Membrane protein n=1 Tax=Legionella lansingensis TaxID=45067 RepID=A0A0W0VJJ2_9GAMM|nr:hypothetical protein [Legionella lansingensis]KTD20270.1 membrane protein [Legionella lansingensis]SNV50277.1 membrane protein [Legionella lansingensis]
MARVGELLRKQGHFLLENETYAFLYIAMLALIPFASWLSAAIIALITLRKGWVSGFKGVVVGIVSLLVPSLMTLLSTAGIFNALMTFLPCFVMACVLRTTASWRVTAGLMVLLSLLGIALIHGLIPELISEQYRFIMAVLKELEREGTISGLLNNQEAFNPIIIANYVIGIQAVSILLSATASLMLARGVQARLFYPGGYRQEMLTFRASSWGVLLLLITAIGTYYESPLAISSLPILVVYYLCAGMSLGFNILTKGKGIGTFFLLLLPLVLLPFITLPIYVILGALDSLFNFRSRLLLKAG